MPDAVTILLSGSVRWCYCAGRTVSLSVELAGEQDIEALLPRGAHITLAGEVVQLPPVKPSVTRDGAALDERQ